MKNKCSHTKDIKKLIVKMGGLLCPKCRLILFYPGTKEFNSRIQGICAELMQSAERVCGIKNVRRKNK